MSTIAVPPPATTSPARKKSLLWDLITTVDHKKIGIMYGVTALFFMLVGGLEATLIRIQLARPENTFLSASAYNSMFTMHGTTMVFMVAMPLAVALFNYLVPLQIGARDVAFPRLNALSYWTYLFGAIFLNASWLFDAAPNAGWFGYANLTERQFSPGLNTDFWSLGLQALGAASIMGSVNFITTIINMRCPGMKLMRMPLFSWMAFITSFLIATALPVFAVALFMISFDRWWATNFFQTMAGGDPMVWQHVFWMFGHPEVYILILPAFGIVSEIIPTFSRKPLFGYAVMVYSACLIALIGWGVWAHHMFAAGMGPIADSFFTISSMIIAIPTGIKVFSWMATMYGGSIRFTTAMLFAVGMVLEFTIGGVSGVMHATSPHDLQQTDTYFIVAHFHYVLVGGLFFTIFGSIYYWFPKYTGRFMNEFVGKAQFWLFVIGFNMTFMPQHWIGLLGMPRRTFTYSADLNLGGLNFLSTAGVAFQAMSIVLLIGNIIYSVRRGPKAGHNPWGGSSLEWATASPPPEHNFDRLPQVNTREPMWLEAASVTDAAQGGVTGPIHMPSPSWWPMFTAFGIVLALGLFMTGVWYAPLFGLLWVFIGAVNWAYEPA
ncbi:MAG TPA: cytochrome c oxidase subunit I [Longimicrobiales bacterium]